MSSDKDLTGKTIVITGANSGIGYVAAQEFAIRGATVAIVCRSSERGQQAIEAIRSASANDKISLYLADLSSLTSTSEVAEQLIADFPKINVLCNNAGGANHKRIVTEEGFETTLATNHLSGLLLTQKLMPALIAGAEFEASRIVFTSSLGHSHSPLNFSDLSLEQGYKTLKAYGRSKLMNLLTAMEIQKRYGAKHIVASSFHPGAVRTPIWSKGGLLARVLGTVFAPFMVSAEQGADTLIWLASSSDQASMTANGHYFFKRKLKRTAEFATDEAAEKLWQASLELITPYL